jgi:hypothetical protein
MPAFLSILFVQGFIRVALAAVGIGVVSFVGVNSLISMVGSEIQQNLSGMPADAIALLGVAKIDVAVSIILSAFSVRASIFALKKLRVL